MATQAHRSRTPVVTHSDRWRTGGKVVLVLTVCLAGFAGILSFARLADQARDSIEVARLGMATVKEAPGFDPASLAALPEPAQRYLSFAILPGAPLKTLAKIEMRGHFGMGDSQSPNYLPMRASQTLAFPHGFVWAMNGEGAFPTLSGSDSLEWTRFWLGNLLPVARVSDDADHRKSAFARLAAETVFWTPGVLLTTPGVEWRQLGPDAVRVTLRHEELVQSVDLSLEPDGKLRSLSLDRWSNANPEKKYRLQRFEGTLSDFRTVDGFRVPFKVEAGNQFGSTDYFPFFVVEVTSLIYPSGHPAEGAAVRQRDGS